MINLIIEGGKTNSAEYTFWDNINKYCLNNTLNIIGCYGVENVYSTLLGENKQVSIPSNVPTIVLIDNAGKNYAIIREIKLLCKDSLYFYYWDMSSFEDLILRFPFLITRLFTKRNRLINPVKEKIELLNIYLNDPDSLDNTKIKKFLKKVYKEERSQVSYEELAFELLYAITALSYNQGFMINKGSFNKCWDCDCNKKEDCLAFHFDKRINKYVKNSDLSKGCGLFNGNKKNPASKFKELYDHTHIRFIIKGAKLYFNKNNIKY